MFIFILVVAAAVVTAVCSCRGDHVVWLSIMVLSAGVAVANVAVKDVRCQVPCVRYIVVVSTAVDAFVFTTVVVLSASPRLLVQ